MKEQIVSVGGIVLLLSSGNTIGRQLEDLVSIIFVCFFFGILSFTFHPSATSMRSTLAWYTFLLYTFLPFKINPTYKIRPLGLILVEFKMERILHNLFISAVFPYQ